MSEVIRTVLKEGKGFEARVGALSGPSFAVLRLRGADPTAITVASSDTELAQVISTGIQRPLFSRLHQRRPSRASN